MASPTAELLVKIGSDTKQLKTGLDKANKQTAGFAKNIQKHSKAIGIAMIAAGAAIIAIAAKSVMSYAKMGDEIAKMAKRTGFSTEALSELRHAAELSGTSLSSLEKASKTLSGAILDAGFGLETYTRAFDKIGLSYERLKPLSPEEQFLAVMESLAGLTDESERAALAADLFGRAGTQLLPMLADGTKGLKEMRQEAHELGIVFDAEAAVKAEEMTDAMTRLKSSIAGAGFSIADALIPVLQPLIDKVTAITKSVGVWVGENEALAKIVAAGGLLMVGLGGLLLILPKIKVAVLALSTSMKALMLNPIVALIAGIALLSFGIFSLIKHHTDWNKVTEAAEKRNEALAKSEGKMTDEVIELTRAYNDLRRGYGQLSEEEEAALDRSDELLQGLKDGIYLIDAQTGAIVSATSARFESLRAVLLEKEAQKTLNAEIQKEIDRRSDLLGIISQQLGLGASLASLSNLTWALTPFAGTRAFAAMGFSGLGIEGLADGGIVTKPTLAMVGESGPEAVIPLDKMGGVTINFSEPVFMDNEETMQRFANKIYREIKKGQRLSFGGAYSG